MEYVIGIDEVGRGPLAGPIVVAAAAIPLSLHVRNKKWGRLRDSKQLTSLEREIWFDYIASDPDIFFATARVYPSRIDQMNISRAANRAAYFAYRRLLAKNQVLWNAKIMLDGNLYLRDKKESTERYGAKTIVKGDEKYQPIMIASIMAKVTRDRYMVRLAKEYPDYGFQNHKGYGTKAHREALERVGPCPVHRVSFLKFLSSETLS